MNDTTALVLDRPTGTRYAAPQRGDGHASSADFGAALASAQEASRPREGAAPAAGRSKHLVQAGETLYGIAKARLAQSGEAATPAASMRHALEIATMNHIRNPDRIYAGQTLELSAPPARVPGTPSAAVEAGRSAAYSEAAATYALHEPDSQPVLPASDLADEALESIDAAESEIDPAYAQTAMPGSAAGGIESEDDVRSRPDGVEKTSAGIALYQQAAAAAAPKPPIEVPDLLYKGIVGKALDLLPLEPSTRTGLQQANAIIGSSFAGRSLAALTGLGGPLLTVAGLLWGIFSAQKISAGQSGAPDQLAQNTSVAPTD